jgi:hypothetical protein
MMESVEFSNGALSGMQRMFPRCSELRFGITTFESATLFTTHQWHMTVGAMHLNASESVSR